MNQIIEIDKGKNTNLVFSTSQTSQKNLEILLPQILLEAIQVLQTPIFHYSAWRMFT